MEIVSSKYIKWTNEDLNFLKENYKNFTINEFSNKLNRSYSSIEKKLYKINLKPKLERRQWTNEEEKYILDNNNKLTFLQISNDLKRNVDVVKAKIIKMGFIPKSSLRTWGEEDKIFLQENKNLSIKELARTLNTTRGMIFIKLKEHGIIRDEFKNRDLKNQNIVFCRMCKNKYPKSNEYFYFNKDGLLTHARCKSCEKKNVRKRKKTLDSTLKRLMISISHRKSKDGKFSYHNITLDFLHELYLKQKGRCALTGIIMEHTQNGGRNPRNISLDRIDNSIGYVRENVQFVCDWANLAKSSLTISQFKEFIFKANNYLILGDQNEN